MRKTVRIYTDGSYIPNTNSGGFAFMAILPGGDTLLRAAGKLLEGGSSRMEFEAVISALKMNPLKDSSVVVYSDCQLVVDVINGRKIGKCNFSTRRLIKRLRNTGALYTHLRSEKVKAHSGDANNSRVDALARNAARQMHQHVLACQAI